MSEMVGRVARVLQERLGGSGDYEGTARAAIAAMREPTEAMLDADGGVDAIDCWHAMVDAALAEDLPP